ncbi:hypothetical protein PR202_gb08040 [Eleusine coracana subsp. coracana]|uniref:Uncharacterized protein n=1 Tax=Eleusine coracana subsp. coracana TaxID=191504 RepID=A0AAV5EDS7_ELECO|nr:hypothetical protein PR202_gb08040 [Eleusine coracana subsp. coracana]
MSSYPSAVAVHAKPYCTGEFPCLPLPQPSRRSASAIVADTARGYHILRIDGYSHTKGTPTGEYIKSHPFTIGSHH